MSGDSMRPLMGVADVAAFTGLTAYTIRQAIRDGELPASKIRGRLRLDSDDVLAWIDDNRVTPAAAASAGQHPRPLAPVSRTRPPAGGYRALAKQMREDAA